MAITFSYGDGGAKIANGSPPEPASGLIKDVDEATFMEDVIDASGKVPVIVDFWADCEPCKQLTPLLEKIVIAAKGTVRLAKVNVDKNKNIAAQLRVQSLPAVYAFKNGRPVDAFIGALPESQIKSFIEKLTGSALGQSEEDKLIEAGQLALEAGNANAAKQAFMDVLQINAENLTAIAGLARAQIEADDLPGATATLATAPEAKQNDPIINSARAALELAITTGDPEEIGALNARIEANENDHEARIELAVALNAAGRSEEAMEHLLASIRIDQNWNDEAARKQLLQFFEAWGFSDERAVAGRRQLSLILFS